MNVDLNHPFGTFLRLFSHEYLVGFPSGVSWPGLARLGSVSN